MISSPHGVETTLGCDAADRAVAVGPEIAAERWTDGEIAYRQQPSVRRADEAQCLGDMPWSSRATAMRPDDRLPRSAQPRSQCCGLLRWIEALRLEYRLRVGRGQEFQECVRGGRVL